MDELLNHSGSEHWWMKDKPTRDWINFGGEFTGASHARQTVQDPHASEYDKRRLLRAGLCQPCPISTSGSSIWLTT